MVDDPLYSVVLVIAHNKSRCGRGQATIPIDSIPFLRLDF